jgi:hypothetical protein
LQVNCQFAKKRFRRAWQEIPVLPVQRDGLALKRLALFDIRHW